jgi:hypothetical protein
MEQKCDVLYFNNSHNFKYIFCAIVKEIKILVKGKELEFSKG